MSAMGVGVGESGFWAGVVVDDIDFEEEDERVAALGADEVEGVDF